MTRRLDHPGIVEALDQTSLIYLTLLVVGGGFGALIFAAVPYISPSTDVPAKTAFITG